ncbi:MAG: GIY-YIG nuclease family protein [Anaerolineaceae bacterium]|nr:GIY-YIG nuclease family protein [Anaerolineaceae bacterium]
MPAGIDFPTRGGSYAVWLHLDTARRLVVGRLGGVDFLPGEYVYLGSAHGPGGLRARLERHQAGSPRRRWHVDYLRAWAIPRGGLYAAGDENLECAWTQALLRSPRASVAVPGFGASDCSHGCPAHLVYFRHPAHAAAALDALAGEGEQVMRWDTGGAEITTMLRVK